MGKASSNKKVARAAKAGGGRARAAGERNLLFPAALALVVVLGTLLVVYARDDRRAEALAAPLAFDDHWHSSVGIYVCDSFLGDLPEFTAPQNGGTHTHGDGLLHIHPFSQARAGQNATLQNWLNDAGDVLGNSGGLSNDTLHVPGGQTFEEGDDTCGSDEGDDAGDPILQVAIWDTAAAALAESDPDTIVTEDFGSIRFADDGQAFTIAFAPAGADIPPPPSTSSLSNVGSDLGVDPGDLPAEVGGDGDTTDDTGTDDTGTDDTGSDDTGSDDTGTDDTGSDDTVADDTTDTTAAG